MKTAQLLRTRNVHRPLHVLSGCRPSLPRTSLPFILIIFANRSLFIYSSAAPVETRSSPARASSSGPSKSRRPQVVISDNEDDPMEDETPARYTFRERPKTRSDKGSVLWFFILLFSISDSFLGKSAPKVLVSDGDSGDDADDASKGKRKATGEDSDDGTSSLNKRPKVQPGAPPPPVFPALPEDPPQVSFSSALLFLFTYRNSFRKPFLTRVFAVCSQLICRTSPNRWPSSSCSRSNSAGCSTSAPSPSTPGGGTLPVPRRPLRLAIPGFPSRKANRLPTFSPTRTPSKCKVPPAFLIWSTRGSMRPKFPTSVSRR